MFDIKLVLIILTDVNVQGEGELGGRRKETNQGYTEWGGEGYEGGFEHQGSGGGMIEGGEFEHGTPGDPFEHQRGGGMVVEGGYEHQVSGGGGGGSSIMHAIGETLVEIGQNTRDMLAGQGGYEEKHRSS